MSIDTKNLKIFFLLSYIIHNGSYPKYTIELFQYLFQIFSISSIAISPIVYLAARNQGCPGWFFRSSIIKQSSYKPDALAPSDDQEAATAMTMLGSEQRQRKMDEEELSITKTKPPSPLNLSEAIEDEVLNQKTARSKSKVRILYGTCYGTRLKLLRL